MTYTVIINGLLFAQQAQTQGPIWLILLSAIIASGTFATGLTLFFNRRKTNSEKDKIDADAADIIQRAAGELVNRIKEQSDIDRKEYQAEIEHLSEQNKDLMKSINEMKEEVAKIPELEESIRDLRLGVELLTQQLIEHGVQPVYPPLPPSF